MATTLLGATEQKENRAGNTGTKDVFLIFYRTRNTKIEKKKTFKEQRNTKKVLLGTS